MVKEGEEVEVVVQPGVTIESQTVSHSTTTTAHQAYGPPPGVAMMPPPPMPPGGGMMMQPGMMQQPGMIDPVTGQYMTRMQPGMVDKEALKELEQFQKFNKNIK